MRFFTLSIFFIILFFVVVSPAHAGERKSNWFSKGYHADALTGRIRVGFNPNTASISRTSYGRPANVNTANDSVGENVFMGINLALDYGINDYFSVEGSFGFYMSKEIQYSIILRGATEEGDETHSDTGKIYMAPFGLAALFHPFPYGEVNPYIGGGYHYTLLSSSFERLATESDEGGMMFKVGFDWWLEDKYGINFDITHQFYTAKYDFSNVVRNSDLVSNFDLRGESDADPTFISLGISYRF